MIGKSLVDLLFVIGRQLQLLHTMNVTLTLVSLAFSLRFN